MADLSYIQATQETKIVGQDSSGNQVNYVGADANGNMTTKDAADGPVTPGTVAANSTLVGAQFNTTLPTATNTQQVALQCDNKGRLFTSPAVWSYKYIAGVATTVVKSGTGTLNTISFSPSSGTLTIYDNTAGSGTIMGVFSPGSGSSAMPTTLTFNLTFNTGLTIVTTNANQSITVTYA
jgi:hypothetical protein